MKKTVILALGALLTLALMVTVIASGCGGDSETPQQKVDKAIQKSKDIKKMHVDYDMNMEIKGDAKALGAQFEGLLPFSLGIKGAADVDNSSDPAKGKGNISLDGLDKIFSSIAGASGSADAQTQLGLGMVSNMFKDMQFVLLDEKLYIQLAGTWYVTDANSAGSAAGLGSDVANSTSSIDQACVTNAMADTSKFGAAQIMTDVALVGTETQNGVEVSHIKANLDLDKALTSLAGVMRDCGGAESAGALEAGKSELNKMFKKKEIEMWIDKDSNMAQFKVTVELDPAAIADTAGSLSGSSTTSGAASGLDSITVSLNLNMSNFGQDVSVSKPSGTIVPLEDLMGSFGGLGSSLGGSGSSGLGGTSTTGGTSTSRSGTSTSGSSTSSYSRTATTSSY